MKTITVWPYKWSTGSHASSAASTGSICLLGRPPREDLGYGLYRADENLRVGSPSRAGAIPYASSRDGALWLQRVVRRVLYVSRESPGGIG
jgi:hypothetical protein